MEGERGRNDVQSLIEAIKSSPVLESRIPLINQLGDLDLPEDSDLDLLAECLSTLWEDSTCSGISQCTLNKSILQVAAKYSELSKSSCLSQFLILGTKASIWCGKHLQMAFIPVKESHEDEHLSLFFQVVLDSLRFSSAIFLALKRSPIFGEKLLMLIVENFILEQLNLTKASISEIKRLHSIASEVLKIVQVIVDVVIKLCRAYSEAIKWDANELTTDANESSMYDKKGDDISHVCSITTCIIENLYELGTLAATGGGNLVTILNISWKGVVTLLQLGKGVLAEKINIRDIILTLISLAMEPLRCAAEAWSSTSSETLAVTEAKRTFIPIKFYLINAVRICSQYPCQALKIYKEITFCVLTISTFGILLSREDNLKAASEALVEFLEPTSFLLLLTMLNSAEVKQESKLQILEWLFTDENLSKSSYPEENISILMDCPLDEIFFVNCESMPRARTFLLGRFVLFLNLLKSSPDLTEDAVLGISLKLECLLDLMINKEVYSSVLVLHIPVMCGSGPTIKPVWNPLFCFALLALKTFMVVVSSSQAWVVMESFLLANLLHPHCLCWEIIIELWCFMGRHAETEMLNGIIDTMFSLFKMIASLEPTPFPCYAIRKMARSICMLLACGTPSMTDRVYSSIFTEGESHLSSVMCTALLMEGFPLNLLTESLRKLANQRTLVAFCGFMESNGKKVDKDASSRSCSSGTSMLPVHAQLSMLRFSNINGFDIENQNLSGVLKFVITIICSYKSATNGLNKDHLSKLLCELLGVISNVKHLYASKEMKEVILELQALFLSESSNLDVCLHQCKPALASFMASLSHMEIEEGEGSTTSSAVWELYHMLLRERHWAFVHLALTAFGYFAARTSCNQLWRFVPHDAALAFDIVTGNQPCEERFMSELKAFLEKEAALPGVTPCAKQFRLLVKEGLVQKENIGKFSNINSEILGPEIVEMDGDKQVMKKKRKLPDGITEGMALLQSGLKAMGDGLAQWRQICNDSKFQDEFSTQLSCLEDVISHLAGLADGR